MREKQIQLKRMNCVLEFKIIILSLIYRVKV